VGVLNLNIEVSMQLSKRMAHRIFAVGVFSCIVFNSSQTVVAEEQAQQVPPQKPPQNPPTPPQNLPPGMVPPQRKVPPPIKKISENLLQLGNILVDTQKKEITVPGRALPDQTLEFVATTKGGMKSYESAIELDTDAVTFNLALILIGLEKSNAVVPQRHFDSAKAGGDPVEIFVEWGSGDAARKVRCEELLYDLQAKRVPSMGPWVYTGSTVASDGMFMAELDGVLIGFVHDPSSIIENSIGGGINAYGSIRLNPELKLAPDTAIKLTVRALPRQKQN
jgi:hypothetical protein